MISGMTTATEPGRHISSGHRQRLTSKSHERAVGSICTAVCEAAVIREEPELVDLSAAATLANRMPLTSEL